jgi:hypothetical protein
VAASVYAGKFIAATETKGELCGRINEEKFQSKKYMGVGVCIV